jgi:hypothetical protein
MKRFVCTIFLLVFMLSALAPLTARAQTAARLESLEVALWPEYDRPEMLVIYLARATAGIELPLTFELPIPASIGEPHAVAAWYPDGRLDDQVSWTRQVNGEWATITAEVETTGLWIEFYAPLETDGPATNFTFTWPGTVSVDSFSYEVLHPAGVNEVQVDPPGEAKRDDDGMLYTRSQLGALNAGDPLTIEISYEQPSRPPLQPAAPYPSNPALAVLEIGLWPEYDQPQTLVILKANLDPSVLLPAKVALPIPTSAGDPFAVAQQDENNALFVAPYERELIGDWAWIVVETDSSAFQVEYYVPLTRLNQARSFTYFWPGGVDVKQLSYEVQQPVGAEGMQILPPGTTTLEDDNLFYTRTNLGPRAVDELALISFSYSKQDDVLTVDSPAPSLDRPTTTTGSTPDLTAQLPLLLALFGGALVLAGVVLFFRFRRDEEPKPRRRKRSTRASKAAASGREIEASHIFCHVCGAQAGASDRYCRRCGAELRT